LTHKTHWVTTYIPSPFPSLRRRPRPLTAPIKFNFLLIGNVPFERVVWHPDQAINKSTLLFLCWLIGELIYWLLRGLITDIPHVFSSLRQLRGAQWCWCRAGRSTTTGSSAIRINNASFNYDGDKTTLHRLSDYYILSIWISCVLSSFFLNLFSFFYLTFYCFSPFLFDFVSSFIFLLFFTTCFYVVLSVT
jgi:hypothetical protein